jgi:molybdopterin converting factor small subunit
MITVNIKLFGIFQDYFSNEIFLEIPEGTSIFSLRNELIFRFGNSAFLNFEYVLSKSVFSNSSNILDDSYVVLDNDVIYLLPPFSGG